MKTILTSCIILFLCISDIKAQAETKSAYVSLHGGLIYVSSDSFSKVYNSRFGFIFGGGIGLPISTRLSLYAKAALFRKSGVPVIYNYKFENNNWILESETKDGSAEFRQWLFNFGLQYNFISNKDYSLGVSGGVNYNLISEEKVSLGGLVGFSQNKSSFGGYFAGISFEEKIQCTPVATFLEVQYNHVLFDYFSFNPNKENIILNLGLRYYFGIGLK